jgi:hypothetical protein
MKIHVYTHIGYYITWKLIKYAANHKNYTHIETTSTFIPEKICNQHYALQV